MEGQKEEEATGDKECCDLSSDLSVTDARSVQMTEILPPPSPQRPSPRTPKKIVFVKSERRIKQLSFPKLEMRDKLGPLMNDLEAFSDRGKTEEPTIVRTSSNWDLSTGRTTGARSQFATIRSDSRKTPRARRSTTKNILDGVGNLTIRMPFENELQGSDRGSEKDWSDRQEDSDRLNGNTAREKSNTLAPSEIQYRLKTVQTERKKTPILKWFGCGSIYENNANQVRRKKRCSVDNIVMRYLHWTFRASFGMVFLSACLSFLCFTSLFATIIMILAKTNPECIGGVGGDSGEHHDWYMDAFALSWTTFSTVGYGIVYSGVSSEVTDIKKCTGLTVVVTLEAFVGVLFAGMCGAVIYAKVSRVQSFAQVNFSDPVVIRYGSGVSNHLPRHADGEISDDESEDDESKIRSPCPVLEFRIVNKMSSVTRGEILDAHLQVVASIDASQACPTAVPHATRKRRRGRRRSRWVHATQRSSSGRGSALPSTLSTVDRLTSVHPATHQAFEEDPTGHLVPRRIFAKLDIESQEHPFFKRIWMVRHILDENSPLLRAHARQMLKENNGLWPKDLNCADGVRAAVSFDQILVSLSGTSNADANAVYSQHVYYFCDVSIGYRFANMLYRDSDGSLVVDNHLINDVTVQAGGGGESFRTVHGPGSLMDMEVL